MTVLVVLGGILAALILFRWARLLAMLALVITIGYFVTRFEAWQATQPPVHVMDDD
jgi:hypothetical protein